MENGLLTLANRFVGLEQILAPQGSGQEVPIIASGKDGAILHQKKVPDCERPNKTFWDGRYPISRRLAVNWAYSPKMVGSLGDPSTELMRESESSDLRHDMSLKGDENYLRSRYSWRKGALVHVSD